MRINELFNTALQDAQAGHFTAAAWTLGVLLDEPFGAQNSGTMQGLLSVRQASMGGYASALGALRAAAASKPDDASIA